MKVLIISSIYPEPLIPKVRNDTKVVHYFAKELVKNGYDVMVYHLYPVPISRYLDFPKLKSNIVCSELDGVKVLFDYIHVLIPHRNEGFSVVQKIKAKKFNNYNQSFLDFEPDYIIVHFPTTLHFFTKAVSKGKKVAGVMHGVDLRSLSQIRHVYGRIIRSYKKTYNILSFRSNILKQLAIEKGIANEQSPIVYSGIPLTCFSSKEDIINKVVDSDRALNILYAGKLVQNKNVETILNALSLCPIDYVFHVIGDGPDKNNLISKTVKLNISDKVVFHGELDRQQVLHQMRESDLFIMVSHNETFGLVYLEAMANGCIVIGTKGQGIDGVVVDGVNGFLVNSDDIDRLSKTIMRINSLSKDERLKLCFAAYDTVSQMTEEKMIQHYENMLLGY